MACLTSKLAVNENAQRVRRHELGKNGETDYWVKGLCRAKRHDSQLDWRAVGPLGSGPFAIFRTDKK